MRTFKEKQIKASEVMELYKDAVWWNERTEQDMEKMLSQASLAVGAWKNNALIGFARAISDGIFRAYIEDVVIHSSYNRKGIGTQLIDKLLKELSDIDVISLFCEEDLITFYSKNEFKKSKSQFVLHKVKR
ncbi:GNAT family N-acetyltransferase [Cytobacillus oceanisediminis]|uniref:GNAT family N-acetyltransferase n=1 Tax=Cytobacillus oceanisediminis TaxID=665099 RepID=UPI001CCB1EB2|nr:GNAT family N-acetyltransferase [Cytobacillus oceanisediminis]MBZ9535745.1 GNAT family N-acetyltransferase [Cytobacillus oceanisediminis]